MVGASIINNEIRYSTVQCDSALISGHLYWNGLNVQNNILDGGTNPLGHCWGLKLDSAGSGPTHYRNTTISRNWINTGGAGIGLGQMTNSVIENNIILATTSSTWKVGILIPTEAGTCTGCELASTTTVRNNTVYFVNSPGSQYFGVFSQTEGTGYVIANNSIYYSGAAGTCFQTQLAAGAYTFVGNNACYGGTWGTTYDATTHITSNPMFTSAPTDFTPAVGSPLIGAGSAAYAPLTDFTLRSRPSPPSIGAYEP